jgi:hypothetical protein
MMYYREYKNDASILEDVNKKYPNIKEGPYAPKNIPWVYVFKAASCVFDSLPLDERDLWLERATLKLECRTT